MVLFYTYIGGLMLKESFKFKLLSSVFMVGFLMVFLSVRMAEADSPQLQLQNMKIDKQEAKVGDTLHLSMDVTSSGTVQEVVAIYQPDGYYSVEERISLKKDNATNLWQADINLTDKFAKGKWKIRAVSVKVDSYYYSFFNKEIFTSDSQAIDLSGCGFFVDQKGYVPELKSVSIDKNKVTLGEYVTLSVAVNPISPDKKALVEIYYQSPANSSFYKNLQVYTDSTSQINFYINPYDTTGTWKIGWITLTDPNTGNKISYYNQDLFNQPIGMDFRQADYEAVSPKGWVSFWNKWFYYDPETGEKVTGWLEDQGYWYYLNEDGERISGWLEEDGYEYFFDEDGRMVTGWFHDSEDNADYYFNPDGDLAYGWNFIDGLWYYFDDEYGALVTNDWIDYDGKRFYLNEHGNRVSEGWRLIDSSWYYFTNQGQALTGWRYFGGKWYFLNEEGKMLTGFYRVKGSLYYSDSNGAMQTGWKLIKEKWYYFNPSSGQAAIGWLNQGKTWYYLDSAGAMTTGWMQINYQRPNSPSNLEWFYFDKSGARKTGWLYNNSKWFYLESDGVMSRGFKNIGGVRYYFKSNGAMAANEWLAFGETYWYYFLSSGKMATGWQTINGKKYYFDSNGVMRK